jgi:hypothetical protein
MLGKEPVSWLLFHGHDGEAATRVSAISTLALAPVQRRFLRLRARRYISYMRVGAHNQMNLSPLPTCPSVRALGASGHFASTSVTVRGTGSFICGMCRRAAAGLSPIATQMQTMVSEVRPGDIQQFLDHPSKNRPPEQLLYIYHIASMF